MAKKTTKPEGQPTTAKDSAPAGRLDALRAIVQHKIATSRAGVDALAKDLTSPDRFPLEVLSWSAQAFEAAAVLQVAQAISDRFDAGESIVAVHAWLQRDALRGAQGGSSSTSPVSNHAAACRTAALAEFEEYLRYDAEKTRAEVQS